jgi:hypothetical protein
MTPREIMPGVRRETTPSELVDLICRWAASVGYEYEVTPHACEFAEIVIRDRAAGLYTTTTVPNAHHGRRLKKHQLRYPVHEINTCWREMTDGA